MIMLQQYADRPNTTVKGVNDDYFYFYENDIDDDV